MVFSRIFGRKPQVEPIEPVLSAAPAQMPILVRQSVFEDADATRIVQALCNEYVYPLLVEGCYLRHELPRNAMRAYHVDYYLAQVANGGHGQFMHNSGMKTPLLMDIREGLDAIDIEPYQAIFRDFEKFVAEQPERATSVAANSGFGQPDLTEDQLDKRFFAQDCYKTLLPANGRWIKALPELVVVPDAEFTAKLRQIVARNPQACARRAVRVRTAIAERLQQPLCVAAHLFGFKHNILPVAIGGGDPSATTPDGRTMVGWGVNTRAGNFVMFLDEHDAVLCEKYLADGRKLTPELMEQVRVEVLASKDGIDKLKAFQTLTHKEVARISNALIGSASQTATNLPLMAAAEFACVRANLELIDMYALDRGEDGVWFWHVATTSEGCILAIKDEVALVLNMKFEARDRFKLEEVRRFAANTSAAGNA